jgi:hypothetical protein
MEQARSLVIDAITLALDERPVRGELLPEPGWAVVESVEIVREGAKHEMWENPTTAQRSVVPRHREIKTPTARGICRQLSVPVPPGR